MSDVEKKHIAQEMKRFDDAKLKRMEDGVDEGKRGWQDWGMAFDFIDKNLFNAKDIEREMDVFRQKNLEVPNELTEKLKEELLDISNYAFMSWLKNR